MNRSRIGFVAVFLLLLAAEPAGAQGEEAAREQDHEELRAMMKTVTDAVNGRDPEALIPLLAHPFSITMVDQAHITSIEGLREYFRQRFEGKGSLLESVEIAPKADALTEFLDDKVGVDFGTSTDTYTLKTGRKVVLHSRWTATLLKTADGWKLSAVHAGVDMLDNPILRASERLQLVWGAGGLIVGLLLGLGWGWVRRRG
jgi:ketosteroid isomerase-like protein